MTTFSRVPPAPRGLHAWSCVDMPGGGSEGPPCDPSSMVVRLPVLVAAAMAAVLVTAACEGDDDGVQARPSPSTSDTSTSATPAPTPSTPPPSTPPPAPTPTPTPTPVWQVGATPLPLRTDGFGQNLPTPPELVDRRLPTTDYLPPPADGAYHSEIRPIDQATRDRMGTTWTPECPVTLDELRYLNVGFWGFDGRPHTGELIVHRDAAENVVEVFGKLFAAQFPIEEMRLINTGDVQAPPTGDGNVTAGFVCRATRQSTQWSAHAYGLAIDINPFHNPYQRGDLVLPELASAYLDRANNRPGMIQPGDVVDTAFADIGWSWGGRFRSLKDYQHFSATGR